MGITRWQPDTCDCTIDYEVVNNDVVIGDNQLCVEHTGMDPYLVLTENQHKNVVLNELKTVLADLDMDVVFTRSKGLENILIDLPKNFIVLVLDEKTRRFSLVMPKLDNRERNSVIQKLSDIKPDWENKKARH